MKNNIETFKDIPGYEGIYRCSDLGRIINIKTGRVLKPFKDKFGHLKLDLYKEGDSKRMRVHALVMLTFVGPPPIDETSPTGFAFINHKDKSPANNTLSNLEYCSPQYNALYSLDCTIVKQYDLEWHLKDIYFGIVKAAKLNGADYRKIVECCEGKRDTYHNCHWCYA